MKPVFINLDTEDGSVERFFLGDIKFAMTTVLEPVSFAYKYF
jgi:hypothetical protein